MSAADRNGAREIWADCDRHRGNTANGSHAEKRTIHDSNCPIAEVPHHEENIEVAATSHAAAPKPKAMSATGDTARPAPERRECGCERAATERSDIGHNIERRKDLRTPTHY